MADVETSLMLLVGKASRKIHGNMLAHARVIGWLQESIQAYQEHSSKSASAGSEPQWHLITKHQTTTEDAVFVIALIDGAEIRLAAGRGEVYAVRDFGDEVEHASDIISAARSELQVEDEEITFDRSTLQNWIEGN